jgi:hypothetical protein
MHTKQVFALGVLTLMGLNQFTLVASAAGQQNIRMRERLSSRLERQEIELSQDFQAVRDIIEESRGVKGLSDFDSSLEFQGKHARVDIPRDETGRVVLDGERFDISVSLPDTGSRQEGKLIADGVVNFPTDGSFSNAVQALPDGSVRMKTILDDTSAPEEFRYDISLKDGQVLKPLDEGDAVILDEHGNGLVYIAQPWAKDANGKEISTYYKFDNNVLIQVVDHKDRDIVYPVVADPWYQGSCASYVNAIWTEYRNGYNTIRVSPNNCARYLARYNWNSSFSEMYWKSGHRLYGSTYNSIYWQWACHTVYAPYDYTWDLEIGRRDAGYWGTVAAKCNP